MHAGVNCVCNVCGSPAHVGAWSMAVLLGQPFEYYYYYYYYIHPVFSHIQLVTEKAK